MISMIYFVKLLQLLSRALKVQNVTRWIHVVGTIYLPVKTCSFGHASCKLKASNLYACIEPNRHDHQHRD